MPDRAKLEAKTVPELQDEAERRGLPKTGNKQELVNRLAGEQPAAAGQSSVAESQKDTDLTPEEVRAIWEAATPASSGSLQPAGEASDPEVHRLLAELETARLNNDEDGMKEVGRKLADLGYSAG